MLNHYSKVTSKTSFFQLSFVIALFFSPFFYGLTINSDFDKDSFLGYEKLPSEWVVSLSISAIVITPALFEFFLDLIGDSECSGFFLKAMTFPIVFVPNFSSIIALQTGIQRHSLLFSFCFLHLQVLLIVCSICFYNICHKTFNENIPRYRYLIFSFLIALVTSSWYLATTGSIQI